MKRKGFYKSGKYPQRICDYFTVGNGLLSNKANCLAGGADGTVYIGTDGGLNYTKADGSIGSFKCDAVKTAYSAKDGTVYFATTNTVYAAKSEEITELQSFEGKLFEFSGIDEIYLLAENALYKLENGKFERFFHNEAAATNLACTNNKITASNSKTLNIVNGKRKHWMSIFPEHSTMPDFKINCIAFDETLGFLWLGTDKGAYIFDCKNNWFGHSQIDALPEEEIYRIRFADDGRVILSSEAGLIIVNNGSRKYLPATRWAMEKDINDAIAVGDSIWTATNSGVTKITEKEMTLREKADYCFNLVEEKYVRTLGYVTGLGNIENCDINTGKPNITDNDGLWTQIYIGSLAYAYAVTKDEKFLEAARRSMKAMGYLTKITGVKGFTARAVRFEGEPGYGTVVKRDGSEWHPAPNGECEWLGETSSDEMTGHFFGFSLYYDFCANDEEKEYIKEIICDIVDHILENNYRLCDVDGLPTTWAIWDPEQLNRNSMWLWEKCINSLEMLTFLEVAYHVSGDEKYRNEFLRLAIDEHYLLNAAQHKKDDGHTCHIDDNLGFLCTATILRLENDSAIRKYLLMGMKHHWEYERPEHSVLYNIIYTAFTDDVTDLDYAIKTLYDYPLDFVNRPLFNSSRKGLVYDTEQERWGERPQLKEALDIDARVVHNYDSNPFRADEGHGKSACSPTPFLLPYWLGRYYGVIEE
ncbi:MAG: hypothetical protein IJE74_11175 [Clostridia bacterium]|nr:hypothetical protein [Clostridia bacterium]